MLVANVAGWVQECGGLARLFGPRAAQGPGRYVDEALAATGIMGGADLAMEVAARCVARSGAQPRTLLPDLS